jgi:hypothetical protein
MNGRTFSRRLPAAVALALSLRLAAPAPAAAITVTSATAVAQPASFSGPCPISFTLVGTITVDGPGTVAYRWQRLSPATGYTETVTFAPGDPLTKTILKSDTCGPSAVPCDYRELVTIEPYQTVGLVTLDGMVCQPFAVTAVAAKVTPGDYTGPCPKVFTFQGKITANGPGQVTYHWAHKPYVLEERTITFAAAGMQAVGYAWAVPADLPVAERWLGLVVSKPNQIAAQPPTSFSMQCTKKIQPLQTPRLIRKKLPGPDPLTPEAPRSLPVAPAGGAAVK